MSGPSRREMVERPIPAWEHDAVADALAEHFALAGRLSDLSGDRDQNLLVESAEGQFVVKVADPLEPVDVLEMQQAALEHLRRLENAIDVPFVRRTIDGEGLALVEHDGAVHPVRVQSYVAGDLLRDVPPGAVSRFTVGVVVGRLQQALAGFFHPAAGRPLLWDVRRVAELRDMIDAIDDVAVRHLVESVVDRVEDQVLPRLDGMPAQVVHYDLNPDNLVVEEHTIAGVIDFGDVLHAPRVADLAVAAAYQLPGAADPAVALGEVVRGYQTMVRLTPEEVALLPVLTAARLCQSITIGAWRASRHPDQADYLLVDAQPARQALAELVAADRDEVHRRLRTAAGLPARRAPGDTHHLLTRRRTTLAPSLRLFYEKPLHLVSGDGVWVTDRSGRRYLDAYNNVVQVGHGHPLIAATLAEQSRRLNTNTRYLGDEVVAYAERLTGLLPDGLDVCFFTSSGSEANDLAWRIARTVTGGEGVVVTDYAYHGSTAATMAMSPEELSHGRPESWVATVPPPGSTAPAAAVEHALEELKQRGHTPGALFLDTILSSDGIYDPPPEYLQALVEAVRATGGLFVADEVQAGLGRVGERFWGFAGKGVTPDIVTLGKPLGNGHPIGAVVTSEAVAAQFAEDGAFFSTFGGNSVSAAVGSAVLAITTEERLAERAERVGAGLRSEIRDRARTSPMVGEVRGAGLFIGVEVVDQDGEPDGRTARTIVESMRHHGVLIGRTGPAGNVLKIRPPLAFEEQHAALLLDALARCLK